MPSVGFRLFADSTDFERGLAGATRSVGRVGERLYGVRNAVSTLAVALGINMQSIAEKVARLVIGFSQAEEERLKNLVDSTEKAAAAQEKAFADLQKKQLDYRERIKQLDREIFMAEATHAEKVDYLNREQLELINKIGAGATKESERLAARIKYRQNELALIDLEKEAQDDSIKKAEKLKKLEEDRAALVKKRTEAEGRVGGARATLEEAQADRGKMSLQELANLPRFGAGVSSELSDQAKTAREALNLQQKAEEARRGGRADEAVGLLSRSDQIKSGLTALRSAEREDPFKALKQALAESERQLKEINEKFAGVEP